MKQELFTVLKGDGHKYIAYDDGSVEGFGEGSTIVINKWPLLLDSEIDRERLKRSVE